MVIYAEHKKIISMSNISYFCQQLIYKINNIIDIYSNICRLLGWYPEIKFNRQKIKFHFGRNPNNTSRVNTLFGHCSYKCNASQSSKHYLETKFLYFKSLKKRLIFTRRHKVSAKIIYGTSLHLFITIVNAYEWDK